MQVADAVPGAKVQMLDGNEYTVASVREANAPEGHTTMTLTTKSGVTVSGDTRQAVLISKPDETEEQIEERKRVRDEERQKKQEDLEKKAEKAGLEAEQKAALRNNPQNMQRAAGQGDQRAINQMLAGNPETYSGNIIHPAYAGVPAGDALRRDNTVYPTDNSPGDSPEREPASPSANPNEVSAQEVNPLKSISGTPSQEVKGNEALNRDRGQMTNQSVSSDDAALLEKQRTTGVSGTSDSAVANVIERMKAQKEQDAEGQMTEEQKKEKKRKEEEERAARAKENAELLKDPIFKRDLAANEAEARKK